MKLQRVDDSRRILDDATATNAKEEKKHDLHSFEKLLLVTLQTNQYELKRMGRIVSYD